MKIALILALLFVAAQALPRYTGNLHESRETIITKLRPLQKIAEAEGAPQYPASRIVNGTQAYHGQFPYQALIRADGGISGGSLISERWVLTAAHCVDGYNTFVVYLGAQDTSANEEEGRLIIEAVNVIIHEDWDAWTVNNDIALLDLGQDVKPTTYIKPIALATGDNLFEGAAARVSGWGKTDDYSFASSQLNYVDLTIISNEQCAKSHGSAIISSTICAQGVGSKSICTGDSGGPLIDLSSGKQIGIVSFGGWSCEEGDPSGYARVTSFIEWISDNTELSL